MFDLSSADLSAGVLDCGGGPASFTAELTASGCRAVSTDPLYVWSAADVRARFEAASDSIMTQVRATHNKWTWSYHRDPDDLLASRRAALERFLADYDCGLRERRYVAAELPGLPFEPGSFGLALCSHFLFLYSDLLSADFHVQSVRELCRVAGEVRIFPLLTLDWKRSPHVDVVRAAVAADGWASEVVLVDYEFQRGGNEMLRIFR